LGKCSSKYGSKTPKYQPPTPKISGDTGFTKTPKKKSFSI